MSRTMPNDNKSIAIQVNIMCVNLLRMFLILVSLVMASSAFADQKIKTKSNIKNDRVQQPATNPDCVGETCTAEVIKTEKEEGVTKDEVDADMKKAQQSSSDSDGA